MDLIEVQRRRSTRAATVESSRKVSQRANPERVQAARQAVFNTVELLENILVYLPFRSIIASQSVCKQFQEIVVKSKAIHRKLFLIVDEKPQNWRRVQVRPEPDGYEFRKLEPDAPTPSFGRFPISQMYFMRAFKAPKNLTPVRLNPLLKQDRFRQNGDGFLPDHSGNSAYRTLMEPKETCNLVHNMHRQSDNEALWRKMYLCDPPCTSAETRFTFEVQREPRRSATVKFEISDSNGITFGSLFDQAMRAKILDKDGKKCAGDHGIAEHYVKELERLHERPAYIKCSDSFTYGTFITLNGVVIPTEDEWRAVEVAAS